MLLKWIMPKKRWQFMLCSTIFAPIAIPFFTTLLIIENIILIIQKSINYVCSINIKRKWCTHSSINK